MMDYQEEKTMLNEAITRAREIAKKELLARHVVPRKS